MKQNTISVIVLTYNQKDTVAQTLESILSQKTTDRLEIIVGDDCSTDGTADIVAEYAEKYPNIIVPVLRDKNLGVVKNYYDILSRATGKYIMGCAGDDYWLPGKVKEQLAVMNANPSIGLTYSNAKIYNTETNQFEGDLKGDCDNSFNSLIVCNHVPAVSICFRKKLIMEFIKEVKPQLKSWLMEDYPLVLWFSLKSNIHYHNKPLCVYRMRPNSVSHADSYLKGLIFEESVLLVKRYFAKCANHKLKRLITQRLIICRMQIAALMKTKSELSNRIGIYLSKSIKENIKYILLYLSLIHI